MGRPRVMPFPGGGTSGPRGIRDRFELIPRLARWQGVVREPLGEQAFDRRRALPQGPYAKE